MQIQLVINILGFLLIFLAGSMLLPIPFSIYYGEGDYLYFILSAAITFLVGFLSSLTSLNCNYLYQLIVIKKFL